MSRYYVPHSERPNLEALILKKKPPELSTRNTVLQPCIGCTVFFGYSYIRQADGTIPCHPLVTRSASGFDGISGEHMGDTQVCDPAIVSLTQRLRTGT